MFGQLYKLEVILANIAYFIIVSDCFFLLLGSSSGGVRAVGFLTRCTQRSGAVFRGGSSRGVRAGVIAGIRKAMDRI